MIKGLLLAVLLLATGTHAWAEALGTDTDTNAHPDIVIIKCADGVTTVSGHACGPNNPLAVNHYDMRASGTLNAATANAAVTVGLNNGEGVVAFQITGVTASGATLTPEASADGGTTWLAVPVESSGSSIAAITADGPVRLAAAGYTNVRVRVSTVGTGTITVASNASSVSTDPLLRAAISAAGSTSGAPTAATPTTVSSTSATTVFPAASRSFWRLANNNASGSSALGCTDDGSTPTATHWTISIYAGGYSEASRPSFVSNQAIQCIGLTGAVAISGESF